MYWLIVIGGLMVMAVILITLDESRRNKQITDLPTTALPAEKLENRPYEGPCYTAAWATTGYPHNYQNIIRDAKKCPNCTLGGTCEVQPTVEGIYKRGLPEAIK